MDLRPSCRAGLSRRNKVKAACRAEISMKAESPEDFNHKERKERKKTLTANKHSSALMSEDKRFQPQFKSSMFEVRC
jgi:hypothetical protein